MPLRRLLVCSLVLTARALRPTPSTLARPVSLTASLASAATLWSEATVAATGCPQHRSRAGTIMLVSDLALLEDPAFKAVVEEYAADQSLFFAEYASAWIKLQENGVAERRRDEL